MDRAAGRRQRVERGALRPRSTQWSEVSLCQAIWRPVALLAWWLRLSSDEVATNTCEFVVGRLLEIRVSGGYRSVRDVDDMIMMIKVRVGRLDPTVKFAIAADWRAVQIMAPATADRVRDMLQTNNPRVLRSSILTLPAHPTTNLQVVRLVTEAENANRRHFTAPAALHQWLSEVLTRDESERLRSFLDVQPSPPERADTPG